MINFDSHVTDLDPIALINNIDHTRRQHDSKMLLELMSDITGEPAKVWSNNVIGFGQYHYTYKTGRQGYWPILSFCPSLQNISIDVMHGLSDYQDLLKRIGQVKTTGNSLVLYKLSDIDKRALTAFLQQVFDDIEK
ncbi:DUF1801 domain-containing protein [Dasania sp. GY-MA-18]|uniref:DUF1801 domain-containing protein n=1 Tax=Dasania phycosphaerae TaxID=2950436 RepID=A0A9J6RI84_9GAMM|nr:MULTISPECIES: DUF1801 domain-containing protein [Dasania]MCR8921646.1 DUF1801 domain-containing protein [Dasania sp. GY-MA-18]MCZ0864074.1 DUF1801 domain-containing protein [Dasania phycosphaerae]MCZ0867802.1 DUF1801 domain-containing protein [Dasania phycosphaerae]